MKPEYLDNPCHPREWDDEQWAKAAAERIKATFRFGAQQALELIETFSEAKNDDLLEILDAMEAGDIAEVGRIFCSIVSNHYAHGIQNEWEIENDRPVMDESVWADMQNDERWLAERAAREAA